MLKCSKCRGSILYQCESKRNFKICTTPYIISNAEIGVEHILKNYPSWFRNFLFIDLGDHYRFKWPIVSKVGNYCINTIPERAGIRRCNF